MNIDKLMADIQKAEPGRYDCGFSDLTAICDASGGGALDTGANCFNYGFLQGKKAARAEVRREKKQLLERDKTGWYDYLTRWLGRNIDNERLLRLVGMRAHDLEDMIREEAVK